MSNIANWPKNLITKMRASFAKADPVRRAQRLIDLNNQKIPWDLRQAESDGRVPGLASIVIPVFNQIELTEQCVDSIQRETKWPDFEIILVDNGSDTESQKKLDHLAYRHPNLRLIRNPENFMYALGNNIGASESKGEYVVFLNNDTKVTPGWLTVLTESLARNADIGLVGPKLLHEDGAMQGAGFVFSDRSKIPYLIYANSKTDAPHISRPREFQAISGACCAMRADDFFNIRGFDCRYINGCEDLDLSFKVRFNLDKKVLYNPESVVYHLESKTEGRWKAIVHNRTVFIRQWGREIYPDDSRFYKEDGFRAGRYDRHGEIPDGDTAVYVPILEVNDTTQNQ